MLDNSPCYSGADSFTRRLPQCTSSYWEYYSQHVTTVTETLDFPYLTQVVSGTTLVTEQPDGYSGTSYVLSGPTTYTYTEPPYTETNAPNLNNYCCGYCSISWGPLDIVYWPQPGSNTDCLSTQTAEPIEGTAAPSNAQRDIQARATTLPSNNPLPVTSVGPDGFV